MVMENKIRNQNVSRSSLSQETCFSKHLFGHTALIFLIILTKDVNFAEEMLSFKFSRLVITVNINIIKTTSMMLNR